MAATSEQVKLTKTIADGAYPLAVEGGVRQRLYFDTELKGFGLCVGAKSKTFFAQRDVNGQTVRTTIGRFGVFTVAQAREEARSLLLAMSKGQNPNREKERRRAASTTFREALAQHLGSNKQRSARTVGDYKYLADQYLNDWLARPLNSITRKDCRDRHRAIGKDHGPYVANSAFRVFRAIYNAALKVHEELPPNPTIAVDWFPEQRRKAAIPSAKIGEWFKQVSGVQNPVRRDFLEFVLFTGLRRTSAATVAWADIDFDNNALLIPKPKGGLAFYLPLSDRLIEILKRRQSCEATNAAFPNSPWVFPAHSRSGHIAEPKEKLTLSFTIHGLRNTFISLAESLDISPYAIKCW